VICKPDPRGGSRCAKSFVGCFLENLFLKSRLRSLTTATNVEVIVAACDLEHWLDFVYMAGFGHPPDHVAVGLTHNTAMKTRKGVRPCEHHTRR
jgi:hypothetical protein